MSLPDIIPFKRQFQDLIERGEECELTINGTKWRIYRMHSDGLYRCQRQGEFAYHVVETLDEVVYCMLMVEGKWNK